MTMEPQQGLREVLNKSLSVITKEQCDKWFAISLKDLEATKSIGDAE